MNDAAIEWVRAILATVKPLAAEHYRLTGKPLGVTGEVAEYVAADCRRRCSQATAMPMITSVSCFSSGLPSWSCQRTVTPGGAS